jgi:hypothetical protein
MINRPVQSGNTLRMYIGNRKADCKQDGEYAERHIRPDKRNCDSHPCERNEPNQHSPEKAFGKTGYPGRKFIQLPDILITVRLFLSGYVELMAKNRF